MNRYLRCYAEISLEAIGHNIREVKKRLPEGVKLLGVVKANAYGHGAVPVASYLENQVIILQPQPSRRLSSSEKTAFPRRS